MLPALILLCVASPVFWAFPEDLAFWRSLGIVLGWLGCGLLLACLILMLREVHLARWLGGLERMYRWHHRLGFLAYVFLLAHPLALAMDAWQESPADAWLLLAPTHEGLPVWSGWAALSCMMAGLALALTPPARLRYDHWRILHGLLALAVLTGATHLLLLGMDPPMIALPMLTLTLLFWRLLRADLGRASQPYVVTGVTAPSRDVVEVRLQPLTPSQSLPAHHLRPGQFVLAAFGDGPGFRGCKEFHPYTLSDIDQNGCLALGIKALGDCTRHLQDVRTGVAVRLQGPFGDFLPETASHPALWLAGGIGITPFMAALRAKPLDQPTHLIYLHRNTQDAAYVIELEALARQQSQLKLQIVASDHPPADLATLLPSPPELTGHDCYLCGPPGLVAAARRLLLSRGVAASHLHSESFDFR